MAANDWIWALPCMLALFAVAAFIWQAAGDVRGLASSLDHQMLRAIAGHQVHPALSLPPARPQHGAGIDHWQLQT